MGNRKKKRAWFKSTIVVLVIVFAIFALTSLWFYGTDQVLKFVLGYGTGITGVAILALLVGTILGSSVGEKLGFKK